MSCGSVALRWSSWLLTCLYGVSHHATLHTMNRLMPHCIHGIHGIFPQRPGLSCRQWPWCARKLHGGKILATDWSGGSDVKHDIRPQHLIHNIPLELQMMLHGSSWGQLLLVQSRYHFLDGFVSLWPDTNAGRVTFATAIHSWHSQVDIYHVICQFHVLRKWPCSWPWSTKEELLVLMVV